MKQKEYLFILGSALIVIVLWVIFNIYHNYTTSTIDPNDNFTIVPIEGSFDQDTINQIKNRVRVSAQLDSLQQPTASPTPIPLPSITPVPTLVASPSSDLSPTPSQ